LMRTRWVAVLVGMTVPIHVRDVRPNDPTGRTRES
jgi:hypothetical protein